MHGSCSRKDWQRDGVSPQFSRRTQRDAWGVCHASTAAPRPAPLSSLPLPHAAAAAPRLLQAAVAPTAAVSSHTLLSAAIYKWARRLGRPSQSAVRQAASAWLALAAAAASALRPLPPVADQIAPHTPTWPLLSSPSLHSPVCRSQGMQPALPMQRLRPTAAHQMGNPPSAAWPSSV